MWWRKSEKAGVYRAEVNSPAEQPIPVKEQFQTCPDPVNHRFKTGSERGNSRLVSRPSTRRRQNIFRPIEHLDAATHASALLRLIQEEDDEEPGRMLNFERLHRVYVEMCKQNHWRVLGWVTVGRAFDLLTTGRKKPYATFFDEDGRARRLRVYPIPAPGKAPLDQANSRTSG